MSCPVCFGAAASSVMIDAARMGVLALLGITMGVLAGFAAFIHHLARHARAAEEIGSDRIRSEQREL